MIDLRDSLFNSHKMDWLHLVYPGEFKEKK
jgi:hypothetical protein